MSTCRSCDAAIEWVRTAKGNMPLDLAPSPHGNVIVHSRDHVTVYKDPAAALAAGHRPETLRQSHFATCPSAGEWRKR